MTSIRVTRHKNVEAGGGGRAGGMNFPLQVPLTLTSHPFPAVVPFSFPQNGPQIFKVPSTLGLLLPTLPFPTPFQGLPPSCPYQPRPLIWK